MIATALFAAALAQHAPTAPLDTAAEPAPEATAMEPAPAADQPVAVDSDFSNGNALLASGVLITLAGPPVFLVGGFVWLIEEMFGGWYGRPIAITGAFMTIGGPAVMSFGSVVSRRSLERAGVAVDGVAGELGVLVGLTGLAALGSFYWGFEDPESAYREGLAIGALACAAGSGTLALVQLDQNLRAHAAATGEPRRGVGSWTLSVALPIADQGPGLRLSGSF